jgi:hypothetical protein
LGLKLRALLILGWKQGAPLIDEELGAPLIVGPALDKELEAPLTLSRALG